MKHKEKIPGEAQNAVEETESKRFSLAELKRQGVSDEAKQKILNERLRIAVKTRKYNAVKAELKRGADVNCRDDSGRTIFIQAMLLYNVKSKECRKILELLLDEGADISAGDNTGMTALHYATMEDDIRAIRFLLRNGAYPSATNSSMQQPLNFVLSSKVKGILAMHVKIWEKAKDAKKDLRE